MHRLNRRREFAFIACPHFPAYPASFLEGNFSVRHYVTESRYALQRQTARSADVCVASSGYAAELAQTALDVHADKVRVVHNGVSAEFLEYSHDRTALGSGPVVFFGRFERAKGIDVFVDALALAKDKFASAQIVGAGPDRQAIVDQIRVAGLESRVEVRSWMEPRDLAVLISRAAAVVLPSRHENSSLAVLSAMAVGAPVISTSVGGTMEIIDDGHTGLLVEPDDARELSTAICRVLADEDLASRLGRNGRAKVRSDFTWDSAAEKFEQIYVEVLDRLGTPA